MGETTVLTAEVISGLGVAMNEARLLGAEVDVPGRRAGVTLSVLSLPPEGDEPEDPRVQILLSPVGRVWAGRAKEGAIRSFGVEQFLSVVQEFGGLPIYGWEFFDTAFEERQESSLDLRISTEEGLSHHLSLVQAGGPSDALKFTIWFDALELRRPTGEAIGIADFIAGGRRWWDGLHSGDPRTSGHGIFPGRPGDPGRNRGGTGL
jgi:hypothetical protein